MSVLATALAFASRGHAVFPVNWPVARNGRLLCSCGSDSRGRPCGKNAAKHPYGKLAPNGLLSATTESGIIKHWFGYLAPQANLGVVTDRLVVVDIDPRHGGDDSFRVLEREHGPLPPTWRALTGGGGEHVIFACPNGVEIASFAAEQFKPPRVPPLGPGVDIRARAGYIVAPPSRHISGRPYAWNVDHHPADVELAPAPDWLLDRLANGKAASPPTSSGKAAVPPEVWQQLTAPVTEYRDMAAVRVVGHLLRRWVNPDLVVGLINAWNQTYCQPPLSDDEIRHILNNVARREDERRDREELKRAPR
jgi:hypothetical protein